MVLGSGSRDSVAETCFTALDKAIKTYRLYDGRGELCESAVSLFYNQARDYLEKKPDLTFHLSGQGFKHGDRVLSAEDRSGQGYFQMFKDGLRQISMLPGFRPEEAKKLVQVLATRNQVQKGQVNEDGEKELEEDTVTRLWDANFKYVRYDAIDSFVEGDVYVPELDKKVSLAQWVNTKMEAYGAENIDEWQRIGPPLKSAAPPPGIPQRGLLDLTLPPRLPEGGVHNFRSQYEGDLGSQMERFSVIWGEMVEKASEEETKALMQMMIGLINEWMDDGNWSGLLRTFLVLRKLSAKPNFKSMVSMIVQASASPSALQRLKPHLEDLHPRSARSALRFHLLLGRPGLEALCRMLADLPPGPIIEAFEAAFKAEKVNPMGLYLSRMRSREIMPVIHSIRRMASMVKHPMVVKALRGAVQREEREIRNSALIALREDGNTATLTGWGRALFDPDTKVRASAIRALARTPHAIGRSALLERVRDKEFRSAEDVEIAAVFKALVRMPNDDVWITLEDLLSKNRVFGGKNIRGVQHAIREALATVESPESKRLLGAERKGES